MLIHQPTPRDENDEQIRGLLLHLCSDHAHDHSCLLPDIRGRTQLMVEKVFDCKLAFVHVGLWGPGADYEVCNENSLIKFHKQLALKIIGSKRLHCLCPDPHRSIPSKSPELFLFLAHTTRPTSARKPRTLPTITQV